jgi:hypothetical protein
VKIWSFRRAALGICAATMLAGCSGQDDTAQLPGATLRGWMSPDAKKTKKLLYFSQYTGGPGLVDVFSVPKYSFVGTITDGIDGPEGLAVDKKRNLYVANLNSGTVTVYARGETSPSLTMNVPHGALDVAVRLSNGYVYVGDAAGSVDVFPPGATSRTRRLTNPSIAYRVGGVAVSSSGDVYAAGESRYGSDHYTPAVVEFANAKGSGKNLGLVGLVGELAGVIVDDHYLIVSDYGGSKILIYPPGQTSPSSTISVSDPDRPAINKAENKIYVPESSNSRVGVYGYPNGTFVTNIPTAGSPEGAALSPAPTH